ncbi:E2F-associated phosphoprotein isoform X1 [Oncorhynchus tshawytscha]|uniref:E2F-associated phosphoprotein n=1 Tax=Oncorhynchus tshawytscha TaxID=74940 RepID=A0A8C8FPJ1_ONCTS|nr:E2F-associated phosphoprotein isoform X1 [Oncorhynchus tshawytscha]
MNRQVEYDSYEIEEPSDEERAEDSSEDELDVLLNGTPDQKRKLIREYLTGESESSSGDEFEKEMEAELSTTIKTMECKWAPPTAPAGEALGNNDNAATPGLPQPELYDNVYFDSDSDEEETAPSSSSGQRRRKQRSIPTNDELLYDPDEDDRDQAWVDAKRRRYNEKRRLQSSRNRRGQSQGLPSSDAVLNCPACMTTLCLDCQRHDKYRTQYRAMFVMNCTVNKEEILRYKTLNEKNLRSRKRRKGRQPEPTASTTMEATDSGAVLGMGGEEIYHPVQCTECSTEVAVLDKDEVYHFFNILASHC